MNPALITPLIFACTALLIVGVASILNDLFFRYRSLLNDRLEELSGHSNAESSTSLFNLKQLAAQASTPQNDWRSRLNNLIEQSGLNIDLKTLWGISFCLGAALALVAYIFVRQWWVIPLALVLGFVIPLAYANARRRTRIRRIAWQLPDAFDAIARAVRAGQTVPAAFRLVADEFTPPISDEFFYCYEQQNLGMSYDAALRDLARRSYVMELRILVVALLVQSRSGGNLIELLNNLSTMARKRIKMQQRMKALTGEARMQAAVLIVLPFLALVAVLALSPEYGALILERPWLLAATAASELIGALWIRQIVRLED